MKPASRAKKRTAPPEPLSSIDYRDSELVLGLVYPVGTNTDPVCTVLENHIKKFRGYNSKTIRLSDYLNNLEFDFPLPDSPEFERIDSRMRAGKKAREDSERDDFLAIAAVSLINESRRISPETKIPEPIPRRVHILRSLKRPEEALALRRIYGPGFFLLGVYAPEKDRFNYLTKDKNVPKSKAKQLISRDQEEKEPHGQRMRDTFSLADFFVNLHDARWKDELWRFVDLLFGHPFHTPTRDENAMFLAYAASLRSASLSRQVGAALVTTSGELAGVGCNDVPCAGGGLYWPGEEDRRDHKFKYEHEKGLDSNDAARAKIIDDIVKRLRPEIDEQTRLSEGTKLLNGSPLMDITEFGRSVHAEMEALLSCSRTGVSPRGGTLYTTTFPCHNCVRHIVAAGVSRVVYIEPYPKSRALELHPDAVAVGGKQKSRVTLEPFMGIGPRRYFDLFSLSLSAGYEVRRKSDEGRAVVWEESKAVVRVPNLPSSYLQREEAAVREIKQREEESDGNP